MIFNLLLAGFNFGYRTNSIFWDKAETLPDMFIIQREIEKAMSGKNFFSNNGQGRPVYHNAVDPEVFAHYYQVWEDFHVLRVLPHGSGTLIERRWVIDIIKIFEKAYKRIVEYYKEKAYKEAQQKGKNG